MVRGSDYPCESRCANSLKMITKQVVYLFIGESCYRMKDNSNTFHPLIKECTKGKNILRESHVSFFLSCTNKVVIYLSN